MSSPNPQPVHCRIVAGGKLPVASGGESALCAAVEGAIAARAPNIAYGAEITVLSSSRLTAILTREGRKLPAQNFARMDGELDQSAFDRFAAVLAEQLAQAGH